MRTTNPFGRRLNYIFLNTFSKSVSALLICLYLAGCVSTTVIHSSPNGAKVYLDGQAVGVTPYTHSDKKIIGTTHLFKLEKEGFAPEYGSFSRNARWNKTVVLVGCLTIVPFLWAKDYPADSTYDLRPIITIIEPDKVTVDPLKTKSKAERLFELKQKLDAKAITEDEFKIEKKKIMDE